MVGNQLKETLDRSLQLDYSLLITSKKGIAKNDKCLQKPKLPKLVQCSLQRQAR